MRSRTFLLTVILALVTLVIPDIAMAQRGGFGRSGGFGGGRSFGGGGGFSRPSGGSRSFGGSTSTRSSGGSFNRSGSFGGQRTNTFSQSRNGSPFSQPKAPPVVRTNPSYIQHNTYINDGGYGGPVRMYGGWSDYSYRWVHPAWYFWTPFHPAFYYSPPYYSNGYYEPGGFSFFRLILGFMVFAFIIWLLVRIFAPRRNNYYSPPPPPDVW